MCEAAALGGQTEESVSPASYLEVSLYCMAPKRIPVALTELWNGLMIPAMKAFTWRKFAWPILEEPSTRKTISAACTLLHLPANTRIRADVRWQELLSAEEDRWGGEHFTLSFSSLHGRQEDCRREEPGPHLNSLNKQRIRFGLSLLPFVEKHIGLCFSSASLSTVFF